MARNCPECTRELIAIEEPGDFGSVINVEWVHDDDGTSECESVGEPLPDFDSEGLYMGITSGPEHDTEDESDNVEEPSRGQYGFCRICQAYGYSNEHSREICA